MRVTAPPTPPTDRHVHAIAGWRRWLLWPLAFVVRLWSRTLRFEVPADFAARTSAHEGPLAVVLWHNRLFAIAEIYRRLRRHHAVYGLVSASRDGAWLAAFFELMGVRVVRGSSSRFGREALHALAARLRDGDDIGITPDGPRGPCYDFKAGGVLVARRTGTPLFLLGVEFERAWRLPSWDGFYVPWPWSNLRLRHEYWPAERLGTDDTATAAALRARMLALNPDLRPLRARHLTAGPRASAKDETDAPGNQHRA